MASFTEELDVARSIALHAGELALRYGSGGIHFEPKSDDSPVTAADRDCETLISRALSERFPADGLLGEEGARKSSGNSRRWIIDPIDGTRDFIRGNRSWAVLLALEAEGEVVLGIANFPAAGELYAASRGQGAFLNGRPIRVSGATGPSEAVLCVNELHNVARHAFAARLLGWMQQFWAVRSFGGCMDAVMVARGQADLWVEPSAKAWDIAPLKIIAEEAGARFFNFDGGGSIYGGNCVICTPALEPAALELLN